MRPISYLSTYSDSPLLSNWSQGSPASVSRSGSVSHSGSGPGNSALSPPSSFLARPHAAPLRAVAPSFASSRRQSTIPDFEPLTRVGEVDESNEGRENGDSKTPSERTALEKGYRRISADLVDEPESGDDSDSDDGVALDANGTAAPGTADEKGTKENGKRRRSRLWLFKRKQKRELKVHGPIKELLDRALWTMQTGHRAVGVCCCDQCCDCGDER